MLFVVLGLLGVALTVLIPLAVVQRRALLGPAVRERQLAFAELAIDEIPDPPRSPAKRVRPELTMATPASPSVSIGRIAVGVWLGLWLFCVSVAIPAGLVFLALWRRAGGRW